MKRYTSLFDAKIVTELLSHLEQVELAHVEFYDEAESTVVFLDKKHVDTLGYQELIANEFNTLCVADYVVKLNKDSSFNIIKCRFSHPETLETYINFLLDSAFVLSKPLKMYLILSHFISTNNLKVDKSDKILSDMDTIWLHKLKDNERELFRN